jgi:hypothetical protein
MTPLEETTELSKIMWRAEALAARQPPASSDAWQALADQAVALARQGTLARSALFASMLCARADAIRRQEAGDDAAAVALLAYVERCLNGMAQIDAYCPRLEHWKLEEPEP